MIGSGKSEAAEDRRGSGRGGMCVDIDEPGLDIGDAVGIVRRFGLAQQGLALEIGLQHDIDEAFRAVGGFLRETADAPARRQRDGPALDRQFATDRAKQS